MVSQIRNNYFFPKMPVGYWSILAIDFFTNFSFGVIYSSLILYAKTELHYSNYSAISLIGDVLAFNYALHLLVGVMVNRFLSYRVFLIFSILFITIGLLVLSLQDNYSVYLGLSCITTGLGIISICVYLFISEIFTGHESLRQTGFIWEAGAQNIAYLASLAMAGWFQLSGQYTLLFKITSIVCALSFIFIYRTWKLLGDRSSRLNALNHNQRRLRLSVGIATLLCLIPLLFFLLQAPKLSSVIVILFGGVLLIYLGFQYFHLKVKNEKYKFLIFIILWCFLIFYNSINYLTPMIMTIFDLHNVNRNIFGLTFPIAWIEDITVITTIILAPIFAYVLNLCRQKNKKVSTPALFFYGFIATGLSLLVLSLGIFFADKQGFIAFHWLICNIFIFCIGSLCVVPTALSMVSELTPQSLLGIAMGAVTFSNALANIFSSFFSLEVVKQQKDMSPLLTNLHYFTMFSFLGYLTLFLALILAFVSWYGYRQ